MGIFTCYNSEIELVNLAFAALNVITYGLWWNKPLNIGYPIYFDEDGKRVDGPLSEVNTTGGEVQVMKGVEAWCSNMWRSVRDCVGEACQSVREGWRESLQEYGLAAVIVVPFLAFFAPLAYMMAEDGGESRPTSVHPFYATEMDVNDQSLAFVCSSAIGVIFGAIHLIGWNFLFPTTTELWLWRASSLALTIIPFSLAVGIALSLKYEQDAAVNLTAFFGPPVYFAARIILLFLAFFTLRDLPDSAYQNVRWTEFIPHI
ncbi:hypothetical protein AX16_007502 [Volvariella volvacea WC 439]|nr:hypothetical protein AX16_007502 [Volvariella volvacea WC 439]